jgi:aspartate-semialdehyde dehydrogenase
MSAAPFRVGITGPSTLLGKEILGVLEERHFPLTHVSALAEYPTEPESPVLNISGEALPVVEESEPGETECDFVFLANPGDSVEIARREKRPFVVDAREGPETPSEAVLAAPLLDDAAERLVAAVRDGTRVFASPHPAAIAVALLVLRLCASLEIEHISVTIFNPASALGPTAIDELQKQTLGLLNFGKVPRGLFGAQSAFNILPRLGGETERVFAGIETRIRKDLDCILEGRSPVPAVHLLQVPVFYSTGFSIYARAARPVNAVKVEQSLGGEGVRWTRASAAPSAPMDVQGSALVLVDPVIADRRNPAGFWLWARVDDLRLAAENAVAIAELLIPFIGQP